MVQPRTGWSNTSSRNFMTARISPQNVFVLITNLFVIKQMRSLRRLRPVLVMKFKALEQLIFKKSYLWLKVYCYMITILLE